MSSAAQIAASPPLSAGRLDALDSAVADLDRDQLLWSSGYLAGLARREAPVAAPAADADEVPTLTVLYATETGNCRRIAGNLAELAASNGMAADVVDLAEFKPRQLARIARALFVVATHGVGDPPEGTEGFFELWLGDTAPALANLSYGVLALGDSSYADFCETGRQLDAALERRGARRLLPRVDCDVDFVDAARRWAADAVELAANSGAGSPGRTVLRAVPAEPAVSRERPFTAAVLANQRITGPDSTKDVRHVELDVDGADLSYLPGDSLGIHAVNPARIVDSVLDACGLDGDAEVSLGGDSLALADALAGRLEITALSRPLFDALALEHAGLAELLGERERFAELLATRQVGDLLREYPVAWSAQSLVDALRRLPPRLYSIASSPDANPGEVHLTVGVVDYERFGRPHWGSASGHLADEPETVSVYVEPNPQFRLPADGSVPVVMIGAGTGIAPYRAFLEHRQEQGQRGANWLLFGDRNFARDFLYQREWLAARKDGYLDRLDVAFSRDQPDKRYVQHLVAEQGRRLLDWLDRGAFLYVCGDAKGMAPGVEAALLDVFRREAGMGGDAAAERLAALRAAGRYRRDLY